MFGIESILTAGSPILSEAVKQPAGPSAAGGGAIGDAMFDNSGWNVNFGAGGIESSRAQADSLQGYMPYLLVGAAVLVVLAWIKKR